MTDPRRVAGGYDGEFRPPVLHMLPADVAVALAAGAGNVTNPAGTARLREYWTTGEGGRVKIRWGSQGAYTRCLTELAKYLPRPDQVHGYCANLCKIATGEYPGQGKDSRPGV